MLKYPLSFLLGVFSVVMPFKVLSLRIYYWYTLLSVAETTFSFTSSLRGESSPSSSLDYSGVMTSFGFGMVNKEEEVWKIGVLWSAGPFNWNGFPVLKTGTAKPRGCWVSPFVIGLAPNKLSFLNLKFCPVLTTGIIPPWSSVFTNLRFC